MKVIVIVDGSRISVQMQLDDFLVPRYRAKVNRRTKRGGAAYDALFRRSPRSTGGGAKASPALGKQTTLERFKRPTRQATVPVGQRNVHLPHHMAPRVADHGEFAAGKIDPMELAALKECVSCSGYLGHVFALEDFAAFESAEFSLEQERPFGRFNPVDVLKLEVARCKLGIGRYGEWARLLDAAWPLFLDELHLDCHSTPGARQYSAMVAALGSSNLFNYFQHLVEQEVSFGLVDFKLGIWDARFVESNCSGRTNKATGTLYDPEAGKCKLHSGYKGVGYKESIVYDGLLGLKVYYEVLAANRNDKPLYRLAYTHYVGAGWPPFQYMLADGGAGGSVENNRITREFGTIPILRWKKSSKPYVIKVGKGYYFDGRAIPAHLHPVLERFYAVRTTCERTNSGDDWVYDRDRMPNRGVENARIFVGIQNITEALTACTAFKVGRPDLARSPAAFRRLGASPPALVPRHVDGGIPPVAQACVA